ncbi:hypothetical protein, partial [Mycobacterium canetti]|uniref:hypothetical protein n=1 Tax=Mycobacterium canetti TaxID=78331 RepID=UPI001E62E2F9
PIPARIVATLELDRAAPQRPIPARIPVGTDELNVEAHHSAGLCRQITGVLLHAAIRPPGTDAD